MTNTVEDLEILAEIKRRGLKVFIDSSNGSLTSVPNFYVLPPSLRPVNSLIDPSKSPLLPVIDLADLHSSRRMEVVQAIGDACETWGFFQVVNHGVPSLVLRGMMSAVQQFFDLPFEERESYYTNELSKEVACGTSFKADEESILQWRDYLRHPLLPARVDVLPDKPACYRENAMRYGQEMAKLSSDLLAAMSESLGLASDYLASIFGKTAVFKLVVNYYPPCPNPDLTIGLKSHADASGFTILLQNEVCALQVKNGGVWVPVEPIPGALVINLADQLQILSNGRYKSVQHRVVSTSRTRISISSFVRPPLDAKIAPLPSLLDEVNLPMYKEVVFGEYVQTFFAGNLERPHIDSYRVDKHHP